MSPFSSSLFPEIKMSGSNDGNEPPIDGGDDGPDNSDAVQDTWETGLRQRRRRRSRQNSMGNEDHENDEIGNGNNFNQNNNNSYRRSMNGTPGPNNAPDGNYNASIGAVGGGLCSGGGSATVGVLSNSHHALGHNNAFGGGPSSTPYKTPMKENVAGDLVAATPSSITTAGDTAESTVLSTSPLSVRRRSRRSPTSQLQLQSVPSLRRQYQLLRSQILLLLCTSTIGLILFLFYALPLAAFISLALMTTSMGALVPVARSILIARYEMEMDQPGGLTRYLPEYLRVMLTETSLHDFMTDTTFMMEHRYLLLYFMPGLTPEQLMGYINQLPQRHREALLQPGLGRLMPSVMENLMRIERGQEYQQQFDQQLMLENGDDASGLTVDREQHQEENIDGNEDDNAQVTFLEAVTGLRRTLAAAVNFGGVPEPDAPAEEEEMQTPLPITNDVAEPAPMNNNANQEDVQDDDDNSSFDFSIDIDAHGLNNMLGNQGANDVPAAATSNTVPANNNNPGLRNVIVELPLQPSGLDNGASNNEHQNEVQQQQEYDLEGRILSEAANAAARNYASQAAGIARDTASDAVVATSSWFIRIGSLTGLIAGAGGVVAAVLANQHGGSNLLSITLGTLGGTTTTTDSVNSSSGGASNANDATIERRSNSGYQTAIQGLFATSAFGFLGAGVAYLVRNSVRTSIAKKREEKRLEDAQNEGEDKP